MFVETSREEDVNSMASYATGSAPAARGVRKVNEQTIQEGRALIITEENESNYSWEDIPPGSLKVSGDTGVILVKLRGQGDWVPSNIRIDTARDVDGNAIYNTNNTEFGHTVAIAKDSIVLRENFTILNVDTGNGKFSYEDETGQRFFGDKSDKGFHFELRKGHYAPGRNMLDVIIDDCLYRSAASGGIIEQSETKFIVTEELVNEMELTVKYVQLIRYGNPFPRIYLRRGNYNDQGIDMNDEPENAEVGDIWFDFTGSPEDNDGYLGEVLGNSDKIPWNRITGYPSSVAEAEACNLIKDAEVKGHKHNVNDIIGLTNAISSATLKVSSAANADFATEAGNAQKLQNCVIGVGRGNVVQVQSDGKIAPSLIPNIPASNITGLQIFTRGMIMAWYGNASSVPSGWAICDGSNGTPDLRNRFIIGAGNSYSMGSKGGNVSVTLSKANLPPLGAGYFNADSHNGPYHHQTNGMVQYIGAYSVSTKNGASDDWGSRWCINLNQGLNSTPVNITNPYFALYFIMKL